MTRSGEWRATAARVWVAEREHALVVAINEATAEVKLIAAKLKELERSIDLPSHLGFVIAWNIVGPFDNKEDKGWDVAYEPESKVDLKASLPGVKEPVKWIDYITTDEFGTP